MKPAFLIVSLILIAQSSLAHYIWTTLIFNNETSTKAVRRPRNNTPVAPVTSFDIRCGSNPFPAKEIIVTTSGSTIGFKLDNVLYHPGPAAIYLGKAPGIPVASWNGSGSNWFKIAEWGAAYKPFTFTCFRKSQLTTTIPDDTPPGEYLIRIEQLAMHLLPPEAFVSCAQINITEGGSGNPPKVAIPGPEYIASDDSKIKVNIYWPVPTFYSVPGPPVWRGSE